MGRRTRKTNIIEKKKIVSYAIKPSIHDEAKSCLEHSEVKSLSAVVEDALISFIEKTHKVHEKQGKLNV